MDTSIWLGNFMNLISAVVSHHWDYTVHLDEHFLNSLIKCGGLAKSPEWTDLQLCQCGQILHTNFDFRKIFMATVQTKEIIKIRESPGRCGRLGKRVYYSHYRKNIGQLSFQNMLDSPQTAPSSHFFDTFNLCCKTWRHQVSEHLYTCDGFRRVSIAKWLGLLAQKSSDSLTGPHWCLKKCKGNGICWLLTKLETKPSLHHFVEKC